MPRRHGCACIVAVRSQWTSGPTQSRVELAVKEHELLLKLASEPQRVFTKEELLREVWGFRSLGSKRD
jgi:DNA-binding response OmpR family regulator